MKIRERWPYTGTTKYPRHARDYLAARGILEAAKAAGIVYVAADEAKRLVGLPKDKIRSDGLAIPLAGSNDGAVRFLRQGASPKIKHKKGAKNALYEGVFPSSSGQDWRLIRKDPGTALHIVEGPLKALACTWNDIPAIGINGVYGWSTEHNLIPDFQNYEWRGRLVLLCFDSDITEKPQVRQALKRLGDQLSALGAEVRVKLLPAPRGKNIGADDYIARRGAKKFLALLTKPRSAPEFFDWGAPEVVQELNKKLAFVMHQGRATVLSVREDPDYPGTTKVALSRVSDVELEYANQFYEFKDDEGTVIRKKKFPVWFAHPLRRAVRRLAMTPGTAPGFDPTSTDYNLWQGWGVKPHKPDAEHRWDRLKSHIQQVIANGNKEYADYIVNWLAFGVQFPGRRPEVALVLLGGEGSGKGMLLNTMVTVYGRHALHLVSQRQLVGNFNDHLKDALFIFADEAFFAGDKQSIGALKGMITEPTTVIEPKFVNAYTLPNYKKIAIASNENWVVPADADARRFAVFRVSDKRKGDYDYFKAMAEELANGGYEAMLYELQHRDLSEFDPRRIPITKALFEQKKLSFDEVTTWWFDKLCTGRLCREDTEWSGTIYREVAQAEISERMASAHAKRSLETTTGIQLKKLCPRMKKIRVSIKSPVSAGMERKFKYVFPSLDECRAAFERAMHTRINWKTGDARPESAA